MPGAGSATLPVTNVGLQAPSSSGPLIEPWSCTDGATRRDGSKNATTTYVYTSTDPRKQGLPGRVARSPVRTSFQPYDPARPPSDVATTTTDEGRTVPFVVRVETGYSLRDPYRIAALFDPATQGRTPDPPKGHPGYADKLDVRQPGLLGGADPAARGRPLRRERRHRHGHLAGCGRGRPQPHAAGAEGAGRQGARGRDRALDRHRGRRRPAAGL